MAAVSNDQFHLQWNQFSSDVSNAFRQLRKDADFCDVTLGCSDSKGSSLKAHKVILSASSEKFRQILIEDYSQKEHPNPYIYLKGVAFRDLKLLLDFIYNGEVTLSKENLKSFLKVAKELEIRALCKNQGSNKDAKANESEKTTESKDATDSKTPKNKKPPGENEDLDSNTPQAPSAKSPRTEDATDTEMYPLTESPVRVDPETGMIPQSPERIDPETGLIQEEKVDPETEYAPEEMFDPESGFIPEEKENVIPESFSEEGVDHSTEYAPENNLINDRINQEPEPAQEFDVPIQMEEIPVYNEPAPTPAEEINIFKCRLCEFECSKPKTMRNHLKCTHPEMITNRNNSGDRNSPPTTTKRSSEEGKREKKSAINCSECFKLSGDLQGLDRHIKEAHVKNKLRVTSESDM